MHQSSHHRRVGLICGLPASLSPNNIFFPPTHHISGCYKFLLDLRYGRMAKRFTILNFSVFQRPLDLTTPSNLALQTHPLIRSDAGNRIRRLFHLNSPHTWHPHSNIEPTNWQCLTFSSPSPILTPAQGSWSHNYAHAVRPARRP